MRAIFFALACGVIISSALAHCSSDPPIRAVPDAGVDTGIAQPSCNRPGELDPTFGNAGIAVAAFNGWGWASAAAQDSRGNIVLAGNSGPSYGAARFDSRGRLDSSFGAGGKVTVDLGADAYAQSVWVLDNDKILLAGNAAEEKPVARKMFGLTRLNAHGTVDSTFGQAGFVKTDVGSPAGIRTMAVQKDGRILVAGWATAEAGIVTVLARYDEAGTLDSSFQGGIVTTALPATEMRVAVALQANDKILVGASKDGTEQAGVQIERYEPDGKRDESFGTAGLVSLTKQPNGKLHAIAVQTDKKIVVLLDRSPGILIARLLGDGSLDPSFGTQGVVEEPDNSWAEAMVLRDEVAIVAGAAGDLNGYALGVTRYLPNGSRDTAFGINGLASTRVAYNDWATAILLQPDGKIVAAGVASSPSWEQASYAVARYCP